MRKNANPQLENEVIKLRRRGYTVRQIAKQLNKSTTAVFHYIKSMDWERQVIYIPKNKKIKSLQSKTTVL